MATLKHRYAVPSIRSPKMSNLQRPDSESGLYRGFPNPPGAGAGGQPADLEVGDTAGLEACATGPPPLAARQLVPLSLNFFFF
jgi:hypothetical protein